MAVSSATAVRFRGAVLAAAALLCALRVADAAVACPAAGSGSTSISCYAGGTFSGTPPAGLLTGGLCTCLCGSDSDYDYTTTSGSTTQFVANGTAACTGALCTTNFPKKCAAANTPNAVAVYLTASQALAAQTPAPKVSGTNTICVSLTATCKTGATNPCPSFLSSGTVTQYYAITSLGSATVTQVCASELASLTAKGVTVTALCGSNNCNSPAGTSAAAAAMPAKATLAAAVVALAAVAL